MKITRLAGEMRARGIDVLDLGAGEPDFPSPAAAVEGARRALEAGMTKYTASAGIPQLRHALAESYARRYATPWEMGHCVVTVGAKAALLELALALLDKGDEVVLPSPCWVTFPEQIRLAGAEPVAVPTVAEEGFRIRAEPILAALSERTRAVLVNSPCNPTGGVIEAEDLRRVAEACAERGIVLISDETYERFVYDGRPHASAAPLAAELPETVVVVGSFSKTFSMTGWRVGFVLGPRPLMAAVNTLQSHATSNPTSFAMAGALAVLNGAEEEVEAMIAAYQRRRDLLVPRLNDLPGFACAPPAGAFYVFPRVAGCFPAAGEGRRGSVALAEYLLETAGVAVVPGAAFGDDDHLRISFACSSEVLERALERMAQALSEVAPRVG